MGPIVTATALGVVASVFAYLTTLRILGFLRWRYETEDARKAVVSSEAETQKVAEIQQRLTRLELKGRL